MRIYVLVLILSAVLIQCSPVKLSLSREDMDNLSEYDVKGRNGLLIKQQLSFGNYYTSTVNRSWTKGNDLSVGVSRGTAAGSAYLNII